VLFCGEKDEEIDGEKKWKDGWYDWKWFNRPSVVSRKLNDDFSFNESENGLGKRKKHKSQQTRNFLSFHTHIRTRLSKRMFSWTL